MNTVRGRVRGGHVETETPLPEDAEVLVLVTSETDQRLLRILETMGDQDVSDDLDDEERALLLVSIDRGLAQADRGEGQPYEEVMAAIRAKG